MWINVEDELPIQSYRIRKVKNGKSIVYEVIYCRKRWKSVYVNNCIEKEHEGYSFRILHKVTHWWKCPVTYPKIPPKDMRNFLKRAKQYRHQMQPKKMTFDPPIGLIYPLPLAD